MDTPSILAIVGFLTLLVNAWRAERENKRHTAQIAEDLAKRTEEAARLLAIKADKDLGSIKSDIQDNTEITKNIGVKADAAYEVANHANLKYEALTKSNQATEQVKRIEAITADTNAKVSKLTRTE